MRDCVSCHQHHVFGCKHHTLDCINRVAGVLADGVQVHSALECHKTRWPDHVHVTIKHDVVLELITWAVSLDVVDVHRGLVRSFSSDTGLNDALVHRFVCRRLCIWTEYILLLCTYLYIIDLFVDVYVFELNIYIYIYIAIVHVSIYICVLSIELLKCVCMYKILHVWKRIHAF